MIYFIAAIAAAILIVCINIADVWKILVRNNEPGYKALLPFAGDIALAKIAGEEKLGKRITIAKILFLLMIIVMFVCLILYSQWSVIYIGGDDPNIVESIAGPYWIPLYIMIGVTVLLLIDAIMIGLWRAKIRSAINSKTQ